MGRRGMPACGEEIAAEAARIVCEEAMLDYHSAKLKAAQRLGLGSRVRLPDNARLERAIIDYQRLFGGAGYAEQLLRMRRAAIQAMRLLVEFSPRLVGAVASGAITRAHRVQLHLFCDAPELVEVFLDDRDIRVQQAERLYRFAGGHREQIPLVRFAVGGVGVDAALFSAEDLQRTPLSPAGGAPVRRHDRVQVEALACQPAADAPLAGPAQFQSTNEPE
ncbi:MAG: hypothetical protein KGJ55_01645 [Gammaproteobacteria bacterium]|nr:hypothetical protein [Gammaproteobacteria bacterium]